MAEEIGADELRAALSGRIIPNYMRYAEEMISMSLPNKFSSKDLTREEARTNAERDVLGQHYVELRKRVSLLDRRDAEASNRYSVWEEKVDALRKRGKLATNYQQLVKEGRILFKQAEEIRKTYNHSATLLNKLNARLLTRDNLLAIENRTEEYLSPRRERLEELKPTAPTSDFVKHLTELRRLEQNLKSLGKEKVSLTFSPKSFPSVEQVRELNTEVEKRQKMQRQQSKTKTLKR